MQDFADSTISLSEKRSRFGPFDLELRRFFYVRTLQRSMEQLESGALRLRIPRLRGVRRRHAGLPFHATPEVFLQQEGATVFTMPEEQFVLREGEICLMPQGVPHEERVEARERPYSTLVTMCHPAAYSFHYNIGTDSGLGWRAEGLDFFPVADIDVFTGFWDEIARASEDDRTDGHLLEEPYVRGLLLAALAWMRRLPSGASKRATSHHPLVTRCLDLIQANLADLKLNVVWLARQCGCTPDHLGRLMMREAGRTVLDCIRSARLDLAKELLAGGRLSIGEVAWACGFGTQSHFNRVFLALIGETPGAWRKTRAVRGRPGASKLSRS